MKANISKHAKFLETAHSIPEIAKYTGTSDRFIYSEIERHNLPEPTRFSSGAVRLFPDDLREWLEGLATKRASPNTAKTRPGSKKKKKAVSPVVKPQSSTLPENAEAR
jgi:predicted DNA-binding transcriptional regulator AlpA